jgi:hypothetical protein
VPRQIRGALERCLRRRDVHRLRQVNGRRR